MGVIAWLYVHAWLAILPALLIAAVRWGGKPERTAATMYAVAAALSLAVSRIDFRDFASVEWPLFAIDVALSAALIWLALKSDRFWPIPSAAFQVLSCLGHLEKILEPMSLSLGYQLLAQASTYPTLAILAVGIWRQKSRARAKLR